MGQIAPYLLGGLGLFEQTQNNNAMNSRANDAAAQQAELVKRQIAWYDKLMGIAQQADAAGQFDPSKRLALLGAQWSGNDKLNTGNAAAAAASLGYGVGDSAPVDQINRIHANDKLLFDQQANDIYNQSFMSKLAAYQAANPNALDAGINAYGGQQQLALSRMQDPSGLLGALASYASAGPSTRRPSSPSPAMNLPTPLKSGFSRIRRFDGGLPPAGSY